jgi:hypothetical protein
MRVALRIPRPVALHVRQAAKILGWQLADFQRTLICLGATFFLLTYGNEASEEAATALMGGMKLLRFSRSFGLTPGGRRPYAFRHRFAKSTFATLSLPESVREVITAYADLRHVTRNQVYSKCLQQGLLIYLKAQTTALGAATDQKDSRPPVIPRSAAEKASGRSVVGSDATHVSAVNPLDRTQT